MLLLLLRLAYDFSALIKIELSANYVLVYAFEMLDALYGRISIGLRAQHHIVTYAHYWRHRGEVVCVSFLV